MPRVFDFDGTLVETLLIDYDAMRRDLRAQFHVSEDPFRPLVDSIRRLGGDFSIVDEYEMKAVSSCVPKRDVLEMYQVEKHHVVVSRNGKMCIDRFFELYPEYPAPDLIACRDNCVHLKPHVGHLAPVFAFLGPDVPITVVGDSWHDEQLAKNASCGYILIR